MIYKGFKSSVVVYNSENKIYTGTVINTADYIKFSSETFNTIESAFHESIDNYIKDCELIGKDPFLKSKNIN